MSAGAGHTDRAAAAARDSPAAAATQAPAAGAPRRPRLIDLVLEATSPGGAAAGAGVLPQAPAAEVEAKDRRGPAPGFLERFLQEESPVQALAMWIARRLAPGARPGKRELAQLLARDVAQLDSLLSDQVNAILHHPRLQRLEASWRGLRYLVEQLEEGQNVKIRVLNATWEELARDLERAIEFDQSQLFRKVYGDEFDMPGGEPFGVLLGDYEIRHLPGAEHPADDVAALTAISHVAAAAFAPFVAAADPSLLGLERFDGLAHPLNLPRTFEQLEYLKWRAFRETEDARFVGLALPRVLARLPYEDDGTRVDGFRFREEVAGPDAAKYLWGTAVYAFGAVVVRSFAQSGWLARIRGAQRGAEEGGLVAGLPVHSFSTDKRGIATKCSTDVMIADRQEPELSEVGFLPLCHCQGTEFAAFYANHSVQKPKQYDDPAAQLNAKLSAMLQYMLCVSRFSHYLKVVARDKVGGFAEPEELEDFLHRWIHQYVTADGEATPEVKARLPLRQAEIRVRRHPEKPGCYLCVAHLWPHFELDELTAALRITTELTPGPPGA